MLVPFLAVANEPSASPSPGGPQSGLAPAGVVSVSQAELAERLARPDPTLFLLDVRSPEEFAAGHIAGAANIPYDQVAARLAEVPWDKDVVLYCRSGRRAGLAADVLAANGYRRLGHLDGDIQAWVADGRPVSAPDAAASAH